MVNGGWRPWPERQKVNYFLLSYVTFYKIGFYPQTNLLISNPIINQLPFTFVFITLHILLRTITEYLKQLTVIRDYHECFCIINPSGRRCPVKPKLLTKRAKINFDCQQQLLAISCNSNSSKMLHDRTVNVPDYGSCQTG